MAGWLTNGVPSLTQTTGMERASFDTRATGGSNPQTGAMSLQQIALAVTFYNNSLSKTMVSGTRYYTSVYLGEPALLTGISVRLGSQGGTDDWIVELHNSAGAVVAYSTLSGTLAGTGLTWQQIPFTAQYTLSAPGTYYLVLQSNGNTANFASLNAPTTSEVTTGSATGVFGTLASITPPTTYTANLGPQALVY